MRDWQEIGREIRDEWLATRATWWEERFRELDEKLASDPDRSAYLETRRDWCAAINKYFNEGDASLLIDYLRSNQPFDRKEFAQLLELQSMPPPRGRPPNEDLRELADRADKFYREWRARNKGAGISDWGLSDSMKYQACVYVLEIEIDGADWDDGEDGRLPDPEAIMQLLTRPKSRRKSE